MRTGGQMRGLEPDVAMAYRSFAKRQARGYCPEYERLALAVSDDPAMRKFLEGLPQAKRQPNLLFGVTKLLGGPLTNYGDFSEWVLSRQPQLSAEIRRRSTQTNEAGRCASMLPVLAGLRQPLALLEVGASAGLTLYPDRYRYRYVRDDTEVRLGTDGNAPELVCRAAPGVEVPSTLPSVVWRAGLDLNPLDPTDPDMLAWLTALVWPGQPEREERLRQAVAITATDPPLLVEGDLLTDLLALAAQAPPEAQLVIQHSAVLAYVDAELRDEFVSTAMGLVDRGAVWISNEAPGVLAEPAARLGARLGVDQAGLLDVAGARFVLSVDAEPQFFTGGHGQSIEVI